MSFARHWSPERAGGGDELRSHGRSVDSSLERMQVKVTGLTTGSRFVVACNGRRVPLVPTGIAGEAVRQFAIARASFRLRLHPTIPVHTPLVFDLIDTRLNRSVARCTYFAGPPDGTVHTTRPRDAEEARARRLAALPSVRASLRTDGQP